MFSFGSAREKIRVVVELENNDEMNDNHRRHRYLRRCKLSCPYHGHIVVDINIVDIFIDVSRHFGK
jgi:hypothetical protein